MSAARPVSRRLRALAAVTCLGLVTAACGDDDDEAAAGDVEEYCALVDEINSQEELPSDEQLEQLKDIRPEAVGEDTDMVADAFIEADGNVGEVFTDPEIEAAFTRMEEHDAEVCGFDPPEEEEEPDTEAAEGAEIVPVTAVDYAFEGIPAELSAGPVAFELTNEGEDPHEMVIFQLGEGVDLDELLASEEEPTEEEAREVGGTFAEAGDGGVYANTELEPGTYAVLCFIPGPEGRPHFDLGMKTTFTVS